jgi:crossover junction endodeoxyribonuclease RusA
MTMVCEFFVDGAPAAQGSKRHVGNGRLVEQSKNVGPWRDRVGWWARQNHTGPLLLGAVVLRLEFVMPRPTSTPKRRTPPAIKRPDSDKLQRAVFDALTGIVWKDDSQVVDVHAIKRLAEIGEAPGVHISVSVPDEAAA